MVLSNGAAIPPDMHIYAGTSQGGGRTVTLQPDGRFEFRSIAGALILTPQVRGYRTRHGYPSEVLVDRDVTDLVITLDPQPVPAAGPVPPLAVQPAN